MKKILVILFSILPFSTFATESAALEEYNKKRQEFLSKKELIVKSYAAQQAIKREQEARSLAEALAYENYVNQLRIQNGLQTARQMQAQQDKDDKLNIPKTAEGRMLRGFSR